MMIVISVFALAASWIAGRFYERALWNEILTSAAKRPRVSADGRMTIHVEVKEIDP